MGNPEIQVFEASQALSEAAANRFAAMAKQAVERRGRFLVALSGGSTPLGLYRLLGESPYRAQIPWQQTHLFWGDERLVPPDDEESNYGQVARTLLGKIQLPSAQLHRVRDELSPEDAAQHYRRVLSEIAGPGRQWPRFDLVILGMGSDGHTASLFPGPISDEEAREAVIAVTADYDGRPANRITLTASVFNDARVLLFLATGENKAAALRAVLQGPYQPELWPAQRIRPVEGSICWLVDAAAAANLSEA